jgi:hypothetical protein
VVFDETARRNGHGCGHSTGHMSAPTTTGTRPRTSDFIARVTPGELRLTPSQMKIPKPGT